MKTLLQQNPAIYGEPDSEAPPYVQYKRSKQARRLSLRLDNKERIFVLTIPPRCPKTKAERFLMKHVDWMEDKLAELPERTPFTQGQIIPIFGQNTRIDISLDKTLKKTSIALVGKQLIVRTNREDPSARIQRFLMKLAKEKLSELAHEKATEINKKIGKISVRDTKSRWGSCSADGNLSFSWRLLLAPPEALDYVVAHEVAHLKHLDHSRAFWNVCEKLSEDYEDGKYWMRTNGHELMRFG